MKGFSVTLKNPVKGIKALVWVNLKYARRKASLFRCHKIKGIHSSFRERCHKIKELTNHWQHLEIFRLFWLSRDSCHKYKKSRCGWKIDDHCETKVNVWSMLFQEAKERKREIREAEESACYSVLNTGTPRFSILSILFVLLFLFKLLCLLLPRFSSFLVSFFLLVLFLFFSDDFMFVFLFQFFFFSSNNFFCSKIHHIWLLKRFWKYCGIIKEDCQGWNLFRDPPTKQGLTPSTISS